MLSSRFALSIALVLLPLILIVGAVQAEGSQPMSVESRAADIDGAWDIIADRGVRKCRVLLRAQKSDKGDYFLGMPPACRHTMPDLVKLGRWTMPDTAHLSLNEPTGITVLKLAAVGDGFSGTQGTHSYSLRRVGESGRSVAALKPVPGEVLPDVSPLTPVAKRPKGATAEAAEATGNLAGRYAVMREKRDTGCMLTLDQTRTKGGTRAHLAPGCRDQGIVIFDPSAWQLVKGELVLTARAGHKAHLLRSAEGAWAKDPKDGGKPLGLKKL